ncbi:MAG TPA: hypothetical protein VMV43_11400 [Candidatus Nanopelagicaceae bacterium]|nr:hypothetical protein [Candidatus Nanopelagicaceae bacterium]
MSIAKTLNPSLAKSRAIVPAINVLPTPPFPDTAIFIIFPLLLIVNL